jgi:Flp pilus assembly protein TadG
VIKFIRKFKSDEIGGASIELVLLTPFILGAILASYVFFDAMNARTKSIRASQVISDLLSRQTEIDNDFIDSIDVVFDSISDTRDRENSWLRVTVIVRTETGPEVLWSSSTNMKSAELTTISAIEKKLPIISEGEGLIFLETFSEFTPILGWVGMKEFTFKNSIPTISRFVAVLKNKSD